MHLVNAPTSHHIKKEASVKEEIGRAFRDIRTKEGLKLSSEPPDLSS
jgi:hypothetical protein